MKALIVAITVLMTSFPYKAAQNESKPPAEISLTLVLEAATVKVGSAVSIRTVLSNNSNQIFDASACYCGPAGWIPCSGGKSASMDGKLQRKHIPIQNLLQANLFWIGWLDRVVNFPAAKM